MRTFVLIFMVGVGILTSGCSPKKAEQVQPAAPQYELTGTIKDIMDSIVDPNADFIWGAVSVTTTKKGTVNKVPQTDEEWLEMRRHAISLLEATNLLLIPNRHVARPGEKADNPGIEEAPEDIEAHINQDRATFENRVHRLRDAALITLNAVNNKDVKALEESSYKLDSACEACHVVYWYPKDSLSRKLFEDGEQTTGTSQK